MRPKLSEILTFDKVQVKFCEFKILAAYRICPRGDRMQKYDMDLDRRDLQQLSTAEEIVAFFARLGYSTDARIEQTANNLGITADTDRNTGGNCLFHPRAILFIE